jgi:hypothetical protein
MDSAGVTDERLAALMFEGLNATRTFIATHKGRISDRLEVVDYGERRKMVELVLKLKGYLVDRHEVEAISHTAALNEIERRRKEFEAKYGGGVGAAEVVGHR